MALFFLALVLQAKAVDSPPTVTFIGQPYTAGASYVSTPQQAYVDEMKFMEESHPPLVLHCEGSYEERDVYAIDPFANKAGVAGFAKGMCYNGSEAYLKYQFTVDAVGSSTVTPAWNLGPGCACSGGTGTRDGGKGGGTMVGDPVNAATGNKYEEVDDFPASSGLAFRRFYNSDPNTAPASMGSQWRHLYDRRLGITTSRGATEPNIVRTYRPDGSVFGYTYSSGAWQSTNNMPDSISYVRDAQGVLTGFTLFVSSLHITESYDLNGRLNSITDSAQQTTSLVYSTADTSAAVAPRPGLLLSVVAPSGRAITFSYDSKGQLTTLTLPDGNHLTYTYDNNLLLSVTYPDGSSKKYLYNEPNLSQLPAATAAEITGVIDENGSRTETTTYDAKGRVVSAVGGDNAASIGLVFNSDLTTTITHPLGASTTMSLTMLGGRWLGTSQTGSCGVTCAQTWSARKYDSNAYPSLTTDNRGFNTQTTYDSNGLLLSKVEAQGTADQRTTVTTWDNTLRVPLLTTVANNSNVVTKKSAWTYNGSGQVVATCLIDTGTAPSYACSASGSVPAGVRRTVNTYCTAVNGTTCPLPGLLLSTAGPRQDAPHAVTYAYYTTTDESGCGTTGGFCHHLGDLMSKTDEAGLVTTNVSYDKMGRVTRVKDPNGVLSDMTYTSLGWLSSKTVRANASGTASALDSTTTTSYNPDGTVHQVTDGDGVTTTYTYDAAHRMTDVTAADGTRTHYTLDAVGNRTSEQVLASNGTVVRSLTRTFNSIGQLTALKDGLGQTVLGAGFSDSYDGNGNLVHSSDSLGIQKKQVFDGLNRPISAVDNYQGADAATANSQTVTAFDALDHVTGLSDPDGLTTVADVDALGNSTKVQSPDTGTTASTYDSAGNLLSSTDATGIKRALTYDAKNRPLTATFVDTSLNVQYKYDDADAATGCTGSFGKGHLTRIIEAKGGIVYCYDLRGNVVRKQQTVGTVTRTTSYAWTLANRLKSVTSPNGTLVSYTRNTLGQVTAITATPTGGATTTVVSAVNYEPFGQVSSYKLGDGQTVTMTHDANGELTDVSSSAFSLHVKRDAMGNIISTGNAPGVPTPSETYIYDPLYRLMGVNAGNGTSIEAYTYNKTGDRLSKKAPGLLTGTYGYSSGTHHLISVGTNTRQVDARGNTTANVLASGTYGYGYNGRNRLTVVQNNGATVGTYVLNALGQRVQKTAAGTTTRFDYLEDGRLLSEVAGANGRDYIWLDGIPVGLVDKTTSSTSVAFVHADALGTPRAVTTAAGTTVWQWAYTANPFGEKAPTSATGYKLNLRFPGQYFDAESGLNYNGHRDYEAATGRYIQSDPLGLAAGSSTYGYALSNPMKNIDLTGECIEDACVIEGAAVYELISWAWGAMAGTTIVAMSAKSDLDAQKRIERETYSRICSTPPPKTGDKCQDAKANVIRLKQCLQLREAFSDKWFNDNDPGHMIEIANTRRAIEKLEDFIEKNCGDGCGKP